MTSTLTTPGAAPLRQRLRTQLVPAGRFLAELWRDKAGFAGFAFLVLLTFAAIFAPLIAPHDPAAQSVMARLKPPVWMEGGVAGHLLGTDMLGRDIFSRLLYGARSSLLVSVSVVALAGSFGVIAGLVAGYKGGLTEAVIMRIVDVQVAFPGLLLTLLLVAVIGPSTPTIIVVLAFSNWMIYTRVVRGIVLSLRQTPFIEAAEVVGCKSSRIILRHILPNLIAPLLTLGILEFTNIILAEAALSFLGLGVQPPATSWGLDVAGGKNYMMIAWWPITFPGLCIALTVLSINLFANWLRVTTEPAEREKRYARGRAAKLRRMKRV
ncbi:ABC transporter permease [Celeribacter indicus]|uniref:ABC transporter permease n=1 Tax=Celeribacter indicus TaxID=1208324 RepID=A0A0B5E362_9RHOB|nr:ABC transporter permease [Celeribacter indicus]AJE46877.1 ABC transporter permease [Celeribacter indicus]SDW79660.1 peptide/nickel transport system permease protein [Celeribacter indicus]